MPRKLLGTFEPWPYDLPKAIEPPALAEIWRPEGYLLLPEAFDQLGRALFSNSWTGEELASRLIARVNAPTPLQELDLHRADEGGPIRQAPLPARHWLVRLPARTLFASSREEAEALLGQEWDKRVAAWREEHAARERFDAVVRRMRGELHAERLASWAHCNQQHGDLLSVPRSIWGKDDCEGLFELGDSFARWSDPGRVSLPSPAIVGGWRHRIEGRVVLKAADVANFVNRMAPKRGANRTAEAYSRPKLAAWYPNWVVRNQAKGRVPTRDEEWDAAKQEVGVGVPRDAVRELRRLHAPENWRRKGRRKSGDE